MSLKFISYSGDYPSLCYGTLIVELNGQQYELKNKLCSGGSVKADENWNFEVTQGPWRIDRDDLPEELKSHYYELKELVNDNIQQGCCGGCI